MKQHREPLDPLRIESIYAALQGIYWAGACAMTAFTAVYLAWQGFSDAQIGYTAALIYFATITLSLGLSSYSDKHPAIPLRKLMTTLFLTALGAAALLHFAELPILLMVAAYTVGCCTDNCLGTLTTSLMMQYLNGGLPVRYGWPRGVGSIVYALTAFLLGILMDRHSPGVLMPAFLLLDLLAVAVLWMMPKPPLSARQEPPFRESGGKDSYFAMLRRNPTLVLLLLACILSGMGSCPVSTYRIRLIERLGGGSAQLGRMVFLDAGIELPMMLLSARLLRRFKVETLLTFSFAASAVKVLLLNLAGSMGMLYAATMMNFFSFGIYGFASVLFANAIVAPGETVRSQSLLSLCYTSGLGGILGNLLSGALIDRMGLRNLLFLDFGLCVAGAGIMLWCRSQYQKQKPDLR